MALTALMNIIEAHLLDWSEATRMSLVDAERWAIVDI